MQLAARHAVGALWLVIVVVTSVFVYRSGFGSVVIEGDHNFTTKPILHESDFRVALHDLEMQLIAARTNLVILNDSLHTRIAALEGQVAACKNSETSKHDQLVRGLKRDARGIVSLPWSPRTLDGDDDYLDWNPNSVGPSVEWFKKWQAGIQCEEPAWCDSWYDEQETLRTQLELWKLQHPPDCRKVKALILQADLGPIHGIGSHMHIVAQIFSIAVSEGRVFLPDVKWPFIDPEKCKSRLPDCWFLPLTNCTIDDFKDTMKIRTKECNNPDVQLVGWFDFMDHGTGEIPKQYQHKGLSWWRAQQTKYMMRPRLSLLDIVADYKRALFPPSGEVPHPMLSVNVRHSDKKGEAHMYSWKYYMDEITKSGLRNFGVTNMFLNTEDPIILEELRAGNNFGFTVYAMNISRMPDAGHWEVMKKDGPREVALFSLVQLLIQTECDWFLGTRLSNWSRLIDELRKVNGKARTPYLTPAHDKLNDW